MIDFREHKDLIRQVVKEENDKDKNWSWTVKSIAKHKVRIRWSYLDYCEAPYPKNCFSLTVDYPDDEELGNAVTLNRPDESYIDFVTFGPNSWDNVNTVEEAITSAIRSLAGYAHSRY